MSARRHDAPQLVILAGLMLGEAACAGSAARPASPSGSLGPPTYVVGDTAAPQIDTFYVTDAALAESVVVVPDSDSLARKPGRSYEERLAAKYEADKFAVRGHRIAQGSRLILAYRLYSRGSLNAIDDERFEKLTVELPDSVVAGRPVRYAVGARSSVVARYSRGGSAWPGSACYGEASGGYVELERSATDVIVVTVSLAVDQMASIERHDCGGLRFERRLTLRRFPLDGLTHWLGRVGAQHVYDETYRRSAPAGPA